MNTIGVGIVGAGVRGVYCLGGAIAMLEEETGLTVRGIFDVIEQRSVESKRYLEGVYSDRGRTRDIRVYHDFEEMLNDDECRIVIVTNFTDQHRPYAIRALDAGKKVYLDKPISVTREDAGAIVDAAEHNPLIMGFTRRYEKSWITAKRLLDDGVIGSLQMMEINSIIPYSRYLQTWHRRKELSGGAINDKSSHHFDVFNWMAGEYPQYLIAVGGRSSVFPVDPDAPESCRVCDRECPYRRDPTKISDGAFVLQLDSWKHAENEIEKIDNCVYAPGAEIEDHAIVSVVYPSGVKASLFFAIFGPDTRDQETLTLVGEKGKIFVNRHEGTVTLDTDYGKTREVFDCRGDEFDTSHFGADRDLVRALRAFYDGAKPIATAEDGYMSLEMVLAAQDSIQHGGQPVRFGQAVGSAVD
ncbi:MAG: Gfo/Idh/MocA family protein [Alkalispirochaeta sp.]